MPFFFYPVRRTSDTAGGICSLPYINRYLRKTVMANGKKELPVFRYLCNLYFFYQDNRYAADGRYI